MNLQKNQSRFVGTTLTVGGGFFLALSVIGFTNFNEPVLWTGFSALLSFGLIYIGTKINYDKINEVEK